MGCKGCARAWQRSEWKTRVREVYGPITQHIGQILKTKTGENE